jgi:hypothetical protein
MDADPIEVVRPGRTVAAVAKDSLPLNKGRAKPAAKSAAKPAKPAARTAAR